MRDLHLLEGEWVEERFIPNHGLVSDTPRKGELLVLTNHRVISFIQSNGHKETFFAPLDEMKGISVRANTRGLKNLSQGLIMMILGVLAYLIIGYVLDSVTIGLALGATIILVGGLFIVRHFFWEEEGVIIFQGGSRELFFPYKSNIAGGCVYNLINRFFQLKQHTNNRADHQASAEDGPRDNQPYEAPPTPAPEDDAFVSYSSEYSPWGYPPYELPDPPAPEDDASGSYFSEDGPRVNLPYELPDPPAPEDDAYFSEDGPRVNLPYELPDPPAPEDGPDTPRSS